MESNVYASLLQTFRFWELRKIPFFFQRNLYREERDPRLRKMPKATERILYIKIRYRQRFVRASSLRARANSVFRTSYAMYTERDAPREEKEGEREAKDREDKKKTGQL